MTFVLFLLQKWAENFFGGSWRLVTIVDDTDYADLMQDVSIVLMVLVAYIIP